MINHFLPQRWDLLALEEKVHAAGEAEIDASWQEYKNLS